ncbi:hypothetical protein QUC31_002246 [Theobroma cacao]
MLQSGFAETEEEETSTTARSCVGGFRTESNGPYFFSFWLFHGSGLNNSTIQGVLI